MSSLIKQSSSLLVGLIVIGALFVGMCWAISSIWEAFTSVDAKLAVGVVAAVATVLVATLTATLEKYYERKQAVEAHFRERKVEIYDAFLKRLFKLFQLKGKSDDELVPFLQKWQRKLVVWGGSKVLLTYIKWKNHLLSTYNEPNAETMLLMGDFLLAMRKDLGLLNKGIDRRTFVHLILRNPDLFLDMASRNPNVTMMEVAKMEEKLDPSGY